MDVTRDEHAARTDAAWQRAWDQVQVAVQRRARVGKDVEPFGLLELMEEVYVQMREELHDGEQGPPVEVYNEAGELDEDVAGASYRAMMHRALQRHRAVRPSGPARPAQPRPQRDDDYGAAAGQ